MRVAHVPEMPGTFIPPLWVSYPDLHLGTCVTHLPWCIPGSLTIDFLWGRWWRKRSRHPRRLRNPQFKYLTRSPCHNEINWHFRVSADDKCVGCLQAVGTRELDHFPPPSETRMCGLADCCKPLRLAHGVANDINITSAGIQIALYGDENIDWSVPVNLTTPVPIFGWLYDTIYVSATSKIEVQKWLDIYLGSGFKSPWVETFSV